MFVLYCKINEKGNLLVTFHWSLVGQLTETVRLFYGDPWTYSIHCQRTVCESEIITKQCSIMSEMPSYKAGESVIQQLSHVVVKNITEIGMGYSNIIFKP